MSQFAFLRREWAAVFEAASKAEAAVHGDKSALDEELTRRNWSSSSSGARRGVHWLR